MASPPFAVATGAPVLRAPRCSRTPRLHEGGLSTPIWPKQTDELSGCHLKVEILEHRELVVLGETSDPQLELAADRVLLGRCRRCAVH
jgi:hypothetical protein